MTLNYASVFLNLHTVMKTVLTATDDIKSEAFTRDFSVNHRVCLHFIITQLFVWYHKSHMKVNCNDLNNNELVY
jgi:hypothetical protein